MGGGDGSSQPNSAPCSEPDSQGVQQQPTVATENHQNECPVFLQGYVGRGKYNIGLAGPSGSGKSSLLNDILGACMAESGATECTLYPACYDLPVNDPRGHFSNFMSKLPEIHRNCMAGKLQSVKLWDLPGAGTRLHPASTYIHDKGLRWFDFVVLFIGERVLEVDNEVISSLAENDIKYFLCRSKLDTMLSPYLNQKKKGLGRSLQPSEKEQLAIAEMERVRAMLVEEVRCSVPNFHGHCYLVVAMDCVDDESPNFDVVVNLHETQRALDRLLLDVIKDRHGHDLRCFFDCSLYGRTSRVIFNWFSSIFDLPIGQAQEEEPVEIDANTVRPEDSVSQIAERQNESEWTYLPDMDSQLSIRTEESFSMVSVPQAQEEQTPEVEPRCFTLDALFMKEDKSLVSGRQLHTGMRVTDADGDSLQIVRIKPAKAQSILHLQTASACISVTPSHRVMVPSEHADSPDQDVLARTLRAGQKVRCSSGQHEKLMSVTLEDTEVDVIAVTFQPDKAIAVFSPPQHAILTKGAKKSMKRRGGMRKKSVSDAVQAGDVFATDSDFGMPALKHKAH